MLNQITLVGRLVANPELFRGKEVNVVTFTIAFPQGFANDGTEETGFIKCKSFGRIGDSCHEWLSKGDKIAVSGLFKDTKYNAKDGSTRHESIIHIDSVEFIDVLKTAKGEEAAPKENPVKEEKPVEKPSRNRR